MATKTTKTAWKAWHGFAIEITPETDLAGDGILMIELKIEGSPIPLNKPIAIVSSINEAQDIVAGRASVLAAGTFRVWSRGVAGEYIAIPIAITGRRS